jgi:hypothetical protein
MSKGLVKLPLILVGVLFFGNAASAQSSLTLSSATATAGSSVALPLSLVSTPGSEPAALQWTLEYPSASVASVSVTPGEAALAADKSVSCAGDAAAYICIVSGLNGNTIGNGTVAIVSVVLTQDAITGGIGVSNALGASPAGDPLVISPTGGTVSVGTNTPAPPIITSLSCSPSSLEGGLSSSCSLTLSAVAASGDATVALVSNTDKLAVPPSVTVPANAASASFSISATLVSSDQTATITASLNGSSQTASVALVSPILVSAVQCAAPSLAANSSSSCTVTLSKAAPASGASVTLASSAAALSLPPSVMVPASASTATFTISTTSVPSDQTATITATLNGSSKTASVALVSPILVSAVQCAATGLAANSSSSCTVTLSRAAPASGTSVTLASSAAALSVPASVMVPASASTATFTISTTSVSSDQTATITATLNGSSKTASVALVSPVLVSAVQCAATTLTSNGSTSCTVTVSKSAPATTTVSLSSSSAALSVPASVTFSPGAVSMSFSANSGVIASNQTATTTASLNGSSQSAAISLVAPETVSSLTCAPTTLLPNASTTCTVKLSQTAPAGGSTVGLAVNSSNVTVPASVTVPANSTSASFAATTGSFSTPETAVISASLRSSSASASISLALPTITTLLSIRGDATEVSGVSNAGTVNPAVAPSGLKGKLVINGNGSVKFATGGGVFFLNCCGNSNNAYYKFTGAALGSVFDVAQGQVSFTLQSRSAFAQRQVAGASQRFGFSAMDANGDQFYFLTEVVSGALVFRYMVEGSERAYVVPTGSEDRLFGSGVNLNVTVKWDGRTATLLLNGALTQSTPYVPAAEQWTGTSRFYLGAHEQQGVGANGVSDDVIRDFAVTSTTSSGKTKPRLLSSASELPTSGVAAAQQLSSLLRPATEFKELSCSRSALVAGASALCQVTFPDRIDSGEAEITLTTTSDDIQVPKIVLARKGDRTVHFEVLVRPEAAEGPVRFLAQSGERSVGAQIQITASKHPNLVAPKRRPGRPGSAVEFQVLATDTVPYWLSVSDLPAGAKFDVTSGAFHWIPAESDLGERAVTFQATNSLGLVTTATVNLEIGRSAEENPARLLTSGGPDSDWALALHTTSGIPAAFPSARFGATPAHPGDSVSVYASGLRCSGLSRTDSVLVRFGQSYAPVQSIEPVEHSPEVCRIGVEVPSSVTSFKTPISIVVTDGRGAARATNSAFLAVER